MKMGWLKGSKNESTEATSGKGAGKMNIIISEGVKETLGQRGIKAEEVKSIIDLAESTGKKLSSADGTEFIAKKKIGDVMMYADYGFSGNEAILNSAYSHRMELRGPVNFSAGSEWTCANCREKVKEGHIEMSFMSVDRIGPALICPQCKDAWVEEYLATKTLAVVEGLFEKKRA